MRIQNFIPNRPLSKLPPAGPSPLAPDAQPPSADKLELSSQPLPQRSLDIHRVVKATAFGAVALAIPAALGAAAGPLGVALSMGAAMGLGGGYGEITLREDSLGKRTLDLRIPATIAAGLTSSAAALAGHAYGGPAVALAAVLGGSAMAAFMLKTTR